MIDKPEKVKLLVCFRTKLSKLPSSEWQFCKTSVTESVGAFCFKNNRDYDQETLFPFSK